jgi:hypothetical protein
LSQARPGYRIHSAARSGIRADHSWVLAAGCDASDRLESKVKRRRWLADVSSRVA